MITGKSLLCNCSLLNQVQLIFLFNFLKGEGFDAKGYIILNLSS